jgi:hypothetical protein
MSVSIFQPLVLNIIDAFFLSYDIIRHFSSGKTDKARQGWSSIYENESRSFRTGRLERELQMVQLPGTRRGCIAILWASLVSFAAITLCVASQRVFIVVISLSIQSGNFWIHPRIHKHREPKLQIKLNIIIFEIL